MSTTTPPARRWRVVSYHPTWGEDWKHHATRLEAVQDVARRIAHSPEIHYRIVELQEGET